MFTDALNDAEDILRLNETYDGGYFYSGKALYGLGEKQRAYDIVSRGLQLNPERMTILHYFDHLLLY